MQQYFIELCAKIYHIFFCKFNTLRLIVCVFFLSACSFFADKIKTQTLYFEGTSNKTAMLYKVETDSLDNIKYIPIRTVTTQSKYVMPLGAYLVANECTSFAFTLKESEPTHLKLNLFQIQFFDDGQITQNKNQAEYHVDVKCTNKITGEKTAFTNKNEFYILPGDNMIMVSGLNIFFDAKENEAKNFFVKLVPLKLVSPIENDNTQYFMQPLVKNSINSVPIEPLYAGQVNHVIWVNPAQYEIEINGTKSTVSIESMQSKTIMLGRIRISQPTSFVDSGRTKSTSQPVFAYINKKVLFSLDKDYAVFPGRYSISLDNSEVEKEIEINGGTYIKIPTFGAQVNPPNCERNEKTTNCNFSQKIFVHSKEFPYPIAKVSLGAPFLVFQGDYQYSIEGADGILKHLPISNDSIKAERVGKLKLKWKLQASSSNFETRKIYIESICCDLSGKSEDLNSYKPRELLLPQGEYNLSYFVRQDKGALKRYTITARVTSQEINEVQIPIYTNGNENIHTLLEDDTDQEKTQIPSNLKAIVP